MKIVKLKTTNYRTLESLDLSFPTFYTAICGKNDSGKTNVIKSLQAIMEEEGPFYIREDIGLSMKEDFPKWKQSSSQPKEITVEIHFEIDRVSDAGLFEFLSQYLKLSPANNSIALQLSFTQRDEEPKQKVNVRIDNIDYDALQSREVLSKLRASHIFFFHNSTEFLPYGFYRRGHGGTLKELSGEDNAQVESIKKAVNKGLRKIAMRQQAEITDLLGRLESKYTDRKSVV
jgi:putative ATP-dependent endonuclease of the OLD family